MTNTIAVNGHHYPIDRYQDVVVVFLPEGSVALEFGTWRVYDNDGVELQSLQQDYDVWEAVASAVQLMNSEKEKRIVY